MEYQNIVELVSSVGFPIFACIVMFRQNGKLQETLTKISETMVQLSERISHLEKNGEE